MSNISVGTLSTTSFIQLGDTTGNLVIKTNDTGTGGTTALTLTNTQNANFANTISAVGNVTGSNINTAGVVSATSNVIGGNVTTAGLISATGNVTGGNIIATTLVQGVTVSSSGNVIAGNVTTVGLMSATGNVTAGNVNAAGLSLTGNVLSALNVTSNVTGGNVISVAAISGASISVSGATTGAGAVTYSTTTGAINIGTSQTTGTLTLGGTAQTGLLLIGQSTGAQTCNIATGATATATTKAINIGVGGLAGSTTTIAIGPVTATTAAATVTFNTATTVAIANTGGSALSAAGNITGGNIIATTDISAGGNVGFTTTTGTINIGTSQTTGTFTVGGTSGTGLILIGQSTANQTGNLFSGVTASARFKNINIGTAGAANSLTTMSLGPVTGNATFAINDGTTTILANTGQAALSIAGNVLAGNILVGSGIGGSLYFSGGDYATVAAGTTALAFGTGDFTIEFWVYVLTAGVVYDQRTSTADVSPVVNGQTGSWTFQFGATTAITGGAVTTNAWTHVAVSRQSGSTKLWINGAQSGSTYTDSNSYTCPSGRPALGAYGDTFGGKLVGYVTNLRAVKGTAVYTAAFTPSTAPLTAIANTQLLLSAATSVNYIKDSSTNNFVTTPTTNLYWNPMTPFTTTAAASYGVITAGTVSAVANVIGGNVTTAGLISATGNITGGNVLFGSGIVSGTGNITGGNVLFGSGIVSGTGNITGGNVLGGANVNATTHTGTTVSVTANITGGNVLFGSGIVSGTGNITGGNVLFGSGIVSGTGNITGGNLNAAGLSLTGNVVSALNITGNVTGGNVISVAAISGASISVSGAVTAAGAVTFSATNLSINIGTSQTTGSITLGGTSQTGFITIGQSTASQTANISTGATGTGNTKTINVGVGGLAGSTTTIAIGPVTATTAAGTVTFNTATTVAIANTGGSALSVAGNITGGNVLGGANVNATTHTGTTVSVTGNITGGNVISAALNGTGNVTITSTAANAWVFLTPTGTGTIQVNTDITNGQANGVGNIGNATGYFNTVFAKATSAQYADLAEIYAADQEYLPGTVLSFGGNKEVTMSDVYSDNRVAGVVSTNPSYVMNSVMSDPYATAVALTGRVPTSVTGQVRKGDMMISHGDGTATACSQPAMGTVIGKALEDFAGTSGMIEIVVGRL